MFRFSSLQLRNFSTHVRRYTKTTKDIGREFEDRVANICKLAGYRDIKQNVIVTDSHGNKSEIDIICRKGILPLKYNKLYIECKNYSIPIKFDLVAKFKV